MSNNAPDYENNLVFSPKSQDDLNKQGRESDVLVSALEKCEKLEKQLNEANNVILLCKKGYWFPEDTMKFLCDYLQKWSVTKELDR